MNRIHHWICSSSPWRKLLEERIMPWVLSGVELGQEVLELGPGPGITTDLLRPHIRRIMALEIDADLADSLSSRLSGSNVTIIQGDATSMPFGDAQFSGIVSFIMLHHIPSPLLQDELLREVRRVLKPGSPFAGIDVRQSLLMRLLHIRDTLVPINPDTFSARLERAGFEDILIETNKYAFRFHARTPALEH